MRVVPADPLYRTTILVTLIAVAVVGCSRTKYRLEADQEAYDLIAERNVDPRWNPKGYSIEIDERSRYADSGNPDCPPMPADDPLSNQYMQMVDGKRGWPYWLDNGVREALENPTWRKRLSDYVTITDDGAIRLDLPTALKLAYVHSPTNQSHLETMFLSALDVSAERFRLDSQLFGGYDLFYNHSGTLVPPSLTFDSATNQWVISPSFDSIDSNRVTLGRPSAGNPALQVQRRFASAGQLVAGFANSFVFEFAGGDGNLSSSLANFTFLQPLLAGAGRDVALEQLTFDERSLLANMRSYGQFRQGFYTQVAIGEVGVRGPQRGGGSTFVQVFSGLGGVGGYTGLLQQLQQIRNSEDNLDLQERTLRQFVALQQAGLIDLVQVDQFRQSVEAQKSALLQSRNNLERAIDVYVTETLGLPPDLAIELDDTLIRQFQFIPKEATNTEVAITSLRDETGALGEVPPVDKIAPQIEKAFKLVAPVRHRVDAAKVDLARMDRIVNDRLKTMSEDAAKILREDREQMGKTLNELYKVFGLEDAKLKAIKAGLNENTRKESTNDLMVWLSSMLRLSQRAVLVQARARLESVSLNTIEMDPADAYSIALDHRLDFKNARASLVDSWRLIAVRADALQSVLNLNASGDVRTAQNNPASFRAATSTLRLGVEFDAPLTRLLERNSYREALINYQRSRRNLIQSGDRLHLGLRSQLRQIRRLRENLEIQRRAVAIAIRRVDLTRANLYAPVPPPQPGQRALQFGPTSAFNLLSSLSSLRDTQNSFLGVWLSYYAARIRLAREMGVMKLDENGTWIETPLPPPPRDGSGELIPPGRAQFILNSNDAWLLPPILDESRVRVNDMDR